jgi:mRNA interferase HicA
MTSTERRRWLDRPGCSFETGKGGHLPVRPGNRKTTLPMHGKNHDLPKGAVNGMKEDLGLK